VPSLELLLIFSSCLLFEVAIDGTVGDTSRAVVDKL
jgi:hypothetical protein